MRRSKTLSLGSAIKDYLKESRMDAKLAEVEVVNSWPDVIGPTVARATQNIYVRNGILYVHLKSSIVRNELFMMRTEIIRVLNERVGMEIIHDIVLK